METGSVRIIAIMETPLGIARCEDILLSAPARTVTSIFGLGDFSVALGVDVTHEGTELLYGRSRVIVATRAAGMVPPLDGPYLEVEDLEGCLVNSRRSRALGFQGRVAVYPPQVGPMHEAFSDLSDEVAACHPARGGRLREGPGRGRRLDPARRQVRRLPDLQPGEGADAPLRRLPGSEGAGMNAKTPLALEGVRVVDAASLFAGPVICTMLGDHGADVIKVEHPSGDNLRKLGWEKDGVSLWWALIGRNKRSVTLKLSDPEGAEAMKKLLATADVFVENFRTGTLERWGLGPDVLHEINPGLVIVRTTGFGQTGPYATRPGFGTLAESISGYAHINGFPDGPPTLPPFALGDGVAALTGAFAAMMALRWRENGGSGQVIDLSIYEPLFWILGPQASVYDQLGIVHNRTGNRAPFTAPRNAYLSKDGRWLGLSGSSQSIAERVMRLVGKPEMVDEPWFQNHAGRLEHQDELDEAIAAWIAERDRRRGGARSSRSRRRRSPRCSR